MVHRPTVQFSIVPVPACIFFSPSDSLRKVAGLSMLERLVITLHRAGCASVTLIGDPGTLPQMTRARALGIEFTVLLSPPPNGGHTLLAAGHLLVLPADVERVIDRGGRLVAANGETLPFGVADVFTGDLEASLATAPAVLAEGPALLVTNAESARRAEAGLWQSLTSETDGTVDRYFNRPVGRILSKMLVRTAATPNQVSIVATLVGGSSAFFFAQGTYGPTFAGALILQLSAVIDCVDGDLARVKCRESRLGKWLDLGGDQVVHLSLFTGLAIGVAQAGSAATALALGLSVTLGVLISFGVIVYSMGRPTAARDPRLKRLIDATTNRDFSVLLLVLAALGRVESFLWMAAIGVHIFWVFAVALQWRGRPAPARGLQSA